MAEAKTDGERVRDAMEKYSHVKDVRDGCKFLHVFVDSEATQNYLQSIIGKMVLLGYKPVRIKRFNRTPKIVIRCKKDENDSPYGNMVSKK